MTGYTPSHGAISTPLSSLDPIPEMRRMDGRIHVIFLSSNGIVFVEPTPGPWYRGTARARTLPNAGDDRPTTWYRSEEAASPMGCVEQTQFCSTPDRCGPVGSMVDTAAGAAPLFNGSSEHFLGLNYTGPAGHT